ncbi:uncharacterized protein KY384_006366 [Bacidia gigantensis]|uniref:uncharacterized protein n=1 Tax=Bacidia gigantensis TaxID=2732470 RepID=UPI001D0444DA|nr:uncharacterized protein KY384_006366 [Bacidia gigantensis]KAG8528679.1 hypothetical protein KY384_006366 [Bacidia gigantensis]
MVVYNHVPLSSPRSIRILTLHPAADRSAIISCDLNEVSMDEKPRYSALSYTWGGESLIFPVHCAGALLLTTRNCLDALIQLRGHETPKVLWIDSLCIDQTSTTEAIAERSQQIIMMGEIYKNAYSVIAWLGASDGPVINAMLLIEHLMTRVDVIHAVDRLKQTIGALGSGSYYFGGWKEAMLLQFYLTGLLSAERDLSIRESFSSIGDGTPTKPRASHVLGFARQKGAKCDKDRVFALLSILKELKYETFKPDYNMSTEEIYRKSALMAIENDHDLMILFQVPSDSRRPGLCSWVPDWTDLGYQDSDLRTAIERGQFAAAGPSNSSWSFSEDHLCLNLSGKLIDSIAHRSGVINMMRGKELFTAHSTAVNVGVDHDGPGLAAGTTILRETNRAIEILKSWIEIASRHAEYPTGEPIRTALRRTMTYDIPQENGVENIGEIFDAWYNIMTADELDVGAMALGIVRTGGGILPKMVKDAYLRKRMQRVPEEQRILRALMYDDRVIRYTSIAATASKGKCFFTTERAYMGTAPDFVQVGDRIALVAGLSMPLILRPVYGGYQLITHAYVHGMMYGETWPENPAELSYITLV